jgi:hypothetical protein
MQLIINIITTKRTRAQQQAKKWNVEQAGCCEWYIREHCEYSIQILRKILPAGLESVSSEAINRYYHQCIRVVSRHSS